MWVGVQRRRRVERCGAGESREAWVWAERCGEDRSGQSNVVWVWVDSY